jgi:hypothetical protein
MAPRARSSDLYRVGGGRRGDGSEGQRRMARRDGVDMRRFSTEDRGSLLVYKTSPACDVDLCSVLEQV